MFNGHRMEVPEPGASRIITLEAIVRGIKTPRTNEKFLCAIILEELNKQADSVITSIAGRSCSQKRFLEESMKRINSQNAHFEENTLHEHDEARQEAIGVESKHRKEDKPVEFPQIPHRTDFNWVRCGTPKWESMMISGTTNIWKNVPGDEVHHTSPSNAEFGR
ncbi:unnamed protein product [Thelazia callipaeda]|uniref:Uncharacterized protein n=1 Tax=Thelazia callipaeda TaxID=103827 RepID=A0A0N5D7W2_THECL|nr:unnamed protein product [Thelazia callipaeda]